MRAILIRTVLSALVLSPVAVRAEETATPEAIAGLIQRLGSAKFQERERADRELRRIGAAALKQLKEAEQAKDNEVRERAVAAIRSIEQKIDNDKLLLAPKLRLKYDNVSLAEVLADVAKKTGLKYQLDAKSNKDPKQLLTLDTGDVPYWEAVERFLASAGLTEIPPAVPANNNVNEMYFDLQGGQQLRGFRGKSRVYNQAAIDNTVRLVEAKTPLSCSSNTLVRVKAVPRDAPGSGVAKGSNQITLMLEVTPAPSLAWHGVVNVDVRKVVDDRGIALAQSHIGSGNQLDDSVFTGGMPIQIIQQGQNQIVINGNVQVWSTNVPANPTTAVNPRHVPVTLLTKELGAKSLKELSGVIVAEFVTPPDAIVTLDNIRKAAKKDTVRKGEYEIVVEGRADGNNGISFQIRVRMPLRKDYMAFQARGVSFDGTPIQLQDAAGKAINNINMVLEQSFDGITQTSLYSFTIPHNANPEPAKFVLIGRRLATVEVPFALKDVPLP